MSANSPSPTTTTPADLKNNGACLEWAREADPKESANSTGSVPRAKKSIIRSPDENDPLESAENCIDWVNPQGRKNVPTPTRIGASVVCSIFLKKPKILEGSVILLFLKTPIKFKPSIIMITEATRPSITEKV